MDDHSILTFDEAVHRAASLPDDQKACVRDAIVSVMEDFRADGGANSNQKFWSEFDTALASSRQMMKDGQGLSVDEAFGTVERKIRERHEAIHG